METKYMTYDPMTGMNAEHATKDEALQSFWRNVVQLALDYYHGTPYTVVEIDDEGVRREYTDQGVEIQRERTREEIEAEIARARIPADQVTPVEVLP